MGKPPSDLDTTQRRPRKDDPRAERDRPTDPSRARPAADDRTEARPNPDPPSRASRPSRPSRPAPREESDETDRTALQPNPDLPRARTSRAAPVARARPAPVGAIPAAPRREKTATEIVRDRVTRDWRWTAATMGGAIVAGVTGIALVGSGHLFTGAAALVAMIPLSLAALFVRRAPCPKCGKPIIVMDIEECENCHSFIYVKDDVLNLVESGFVADTATFPLKVPLPVVHRLIFPEEGPCCVCGEPAGRNETLEIQGARIFVAHCGNCENGVTWDLALGADAVTMVTFKFRSFDFFHQIQEANVGHLRAGMWR